MNILIVDDDRFVIASLKQGIPWNELGFDVVYTANNITNAKTILENHSIALLLSDIDMPNGNGLELLSWIRENHNDMPVIFLTNYADFDYAQKAIALKSFHYFLKPIEYDKLTAIIKEAALQFQVQSAQSHKIREFFWHSFLHGELPATSDSLQEYFAHMKLPYHVSDYFVPVIFDLFPYKLTSTNELVHHFSDYTERFSYIEAAFKATFTDLLSTIDSFLEYDQNTSRFLAIFRLDSEMLPPHIAMNCERLIELVSSQTQCTLNCFIGKPEQLNNFRAGFNRLRDMISNSLDCRGKVLHLCQYIEPNHSLLSLDTTMLELYLNNKQFTAFLDYCSQYLHKLSREGILHSVSITNFQIDIAQILHLFLKNNSLPANTLFQGNDYHLLAQNARNSLNDMELYLQYIINITAKHIESASQDKAIAKSIQDYVDQHYAEDINRSVLTELFYLDEDYASKLFKKETGISFKNYIILKRIEVAKNLLQNTTLPINTIAANVGYGNYSYFTRLFKKITGVTPIEYRNQK